MAILTTMQYLKWKKFMIAIVTAAVLFLIGMLLISHQSNELIILDRSAGLNGSFEISDSGYPVNWAFGPNPEADDIFQVLLSSTKVFDEKKSLQIVTDQGERTIAIRSQRVPVQPGKTYSISFASKNDGCALKANRIIQDSSGTRVLRSDFILNTSDSTKEWSTFEEILTISDKEDSVVLIFLVDGPGSLWLDNVNIEEISE